MACRERCAPTPAVRPLGLIYTRVVSQRARAEAERARVEQPLGEGLHVSVPGDASRPGTPHPTPGSRTPRNTDGADAQGLPAADGEAQVRLPQRAVSCCTTAHGEAPCAAMGPLTRSHAFVLNHLPQRKVQEELEAEMRDLRAARDEVVSRLEEQVARLEKERREAERRAEGQRRDAALGQVRAGRRLGNPQHAGVGQWSHAGRPFIMRKLWHDSQCPGPSIDDHVPTFFCSSPMSCGRWRRRGPSACWASWMMCPTRFGSVCRCLTWRGTGSSRSWTRRRGRWRGCGRSGRGSQGSWRSSRRRSRPARRGVVGCSWPFVTGQEQEKLLSLTNVHVFVSFAYHFSLFCTTETMCPSMPVCLVAHYAFSAPPRQTRDALRAEVGRLSGENASLRRHLSAAKQRLRQGADLHAAAGEVAAARRELGAEQGPLFVARAQLKEAQASGLGRDGTEPRD